MSKTLPISEVKARLPELISDVQDREDEVVVTRNGKPAAVLVSYLEYERLKETLDVLSDPDLFRSSTETFRQSSIGLRYGNSEKQYLEARYCGESSGQERRVSHFEGFRLPIQRSRNSRGTIRKADARKE